MRKSKSSSLCQLPLMVIFFMFIFTSNYAQQSEELALPDINVVPNGLAKSSFQEHFDKSKKLKTESEKLKDEKKKVIIKIKNSPKTLTLNEVNKLVNESDSIDTKAKELSSRINTFNTEIEEVVYKDPILDKLSIITYYTLRKDQKLWDEFQKNMSDAKVKLKQDKVRIQQELTKINTKKQKSKVAYNEGVVLSMYTEQEANKALEDSLKSPFTGVTYKEIDANRKKNMSDSGFVIVSFVMPKKENNPMDIASSEATNSKNNTVLPNAFSLATPRTKAELNKLKDKKYNRLIAHSNGATVVECLLTDSIIEARELNIIGGEKSLLNGQALQHLIDNGIVKRVVVWIKLDDPDIWITSLSDANIAERTQNFISYKTKFEAKEPKIDNSKVQYKWILNSGSLAMLNAKDPQFIATYFKEISKDLRAK